MEAQSRSSRGVFVSLFHRVALVLALATSGLGGDVRQTPSGRTVALIIIDVQDCFLPGGSLSVTEGDQVIPVINWIRETYKDQFSLVAVTKDWHCDRHVSFASSHSGKSPFEDITLKYTSDGSLCLGDTVTSANFPEAVSCPPGTGQELRQTLWPVHCVQNVTSGPVSSNLGTALLTEPDDAIITKGTSCQVDFYSAFYDIGRFGMTNLQSVLQAAGIDTIIITGLALDYCVKYTAIDGRFLGYDVYVVHDATRGVAQDTNEAALAEFRTQRIHLIQSDGLHGVLYGSAPSVATLTPAVAVVWLAWINVYLFL